MADRVCVEPLRSDSVLLARFAFQACLIDRSSISPSLKSTTCENTNRTKKELCSNRVGVSAYLTA